MKQEIEVKDMKKKQKKNFPSLLKSLERIPLYSSGSLLPRVCAESLAFLKDPDKTTRAVPVCWCIQGPRSDTTADWAALKFSPEAIMWIILWPETSLYKHCNYS